MTGKVSRYVTVQMTGGTVSSITVHDFDGACAGEKIDPSAKQEWANAQFRALTTGGQLPVHKCGQAFFDVNQNGRLEESELYKAENKGTCRAEGNEPARAAYEQLYRLQHVVHVLGLDLMRGAKCHDSPVGIICAASEGEYGMAVFLSQAPYASSELEVEIGKVTFTFRGLSTEEERLLVAIANLKIALSGQ